MQISKYNEYFNHVIKWNEYIGVGPSYVRDSSIIDLYVKLTKEEVNETLDAIKDKDGVELLDGVFDTFVTASMLNYFHTGLKEATHPLRRMTTATEENLVKLLNDVLDDIQLSYASHMTIMKIIDIAEQAFGVDRVHKVFRDGLASNDSKIITDIKKSNLEHQLRYAIDKYTGQHENLALRKVMIDVGSKKRTAYVIRADHGEGKLLKAESFQPLVVDPVDYPF